MKAWMFISASGLPKGFKLVSNEAVTHPVDNEYGALVQNKNTGLFSLYSAGVIRNIPQNYAQKIAAKENKMNASENNGFRLIDENGIDTFMFRTPEEALAWYVSELENVEGEHQELNDRDEVSIGVYQDENGKKFYNVNDIGKHTNCYVSSIKDVDDWFEDEWIINVEDCGEWYRTV